MTVYYIMRGNRIIKKFKRRKTAEAFLAGGRFYLEEQGYSVTDFLIMREVPDE